MRRVDLSHSNLREPELDPSEILKNLRHKILTATLWLLTVMSSVGAVYAYWVGNPIYFWFGLSALIIWMMAILKNISKYIRFTALLLVIYLASVQDILVVGAQGSHLTYFILLTFFASAIMGFRVGVGVLLSVLISYTIFPALVIYGDSPIQIGDSVMSPSQLESSDQWMEWIRFHIQYFFCASVIIFSTDYLVDHLQSSLVLTHQSLGELQSSNESLRVAQSGLHESEERYKTLAENVRDVVWMSDLNMNPLYISPSIYTQRGYTVEEAMNLPLKSTILPEYMPMVDQALAEELELEELGTADPNRSRLLEYEVYSKDGSTNWVESVITFIRDESGKPIQILGTTRDISERKAAEEERTSMEHQMQDMQKLESLGLLAGGIAHDFNNLLLGIMGNTDLALMELSAVDAAQPFLKDVLSSSQQAAELCKQLLAYSGKGKFKVQPVNLGELVREMTQLLEVSFGKNIAIHFDIADDLPSVEGDITQFRQVIMNLVLNAADAIEGHQGSITVAVRSCVYGEDDLDKLVAKDKLRGGSYVVMEISDTGYGMDFETQSRIFDPFYTTKKSGHGLGLAAVQGIVYGHGGALQVSSKVNEGTCISVLLPATEKEAVSLGTKNQSKIARDGEGTILVVDDEAAIRNFTRKALERAGYQVLTAVHGREALEIFQSKEADIDLVLLDLTMPVMGGEQTYKELQKIRPGLPTIFTSGFTKQDTPSISEDTAEFIQKPYMVNELLSKIREALRNS